MYNCWILIGIISQGIVYRYGDRMYFFIDGV